MIVFHVNNQIGNVQISDSQYQILQAINCFGFITYDQLNMLWSTVKHEYLSFPRSTLRKWIDSYHLLKSNNYHSLKSAKRPMHSFLTLGRNGRRLLLQRNIVLTNTSLIGLNSHNEQAIETIIQAMFQATFRDNMDFSFNWLIDSNRIYGMKNNVLSGLELKSDSNILNSCKALEPQVINEIVEPKYVFKDLVSKKRLDFLSTLSYLNANGIVLGLNGKANKKSSFKSNISNNIQGLLSDLQENNDNSLINFLRRVLSRGSLGWLDEQGILKKDTLYPILKSFVLFIRRWLSWAEQCAFKYDTLCPKKRYFVSNSVCLIGLERQCGINYRQMFLQKRYFVPFSLNSSSNGSFTNRVEPIGGLNNTSNEKDFELLIGQDSYLLPYKAIHMFQEDKLDLNAVLNSTKQMDYLDSPNLLFNKHLDIQNLDFRPFLVQYNQASLTREEQRKLNFIADQMISFKRNGRQHLVFVEFDNRTEGNKTQMAKLLNYIYFASLHPEADILLVMNIADGSVSAQSSNYYNVYRKVASMLQTMFQTTVSNSDKSDKIYLFQMLSQITNLKVVFSGLAESATDIAEFITGMSHITDQYLQTVRLAKKLSNKSQYNVTFEPSQDLKNILKQPLLLNGIPAREESQLDEQSVSIMQANMKRTRGIWRYSTYPVTSLFPELGTLHYKSKTGMSKSFDQPVIPASEHDVNDFINIMHCITDNKSKIKPLVVFPTRERPLTTMSTYAIEKLQTWNAYFTPLQVTYLQPQYGLDNDYQLFKDMRYLLLHYPEDIRRYFTIGALTPAQLKKNISYGNEYVHPEYLYDREAPRSYEKLRKLANKMSAEDFVKQLKIYEVPIGVYNSLIDRTGIAQSFSLPLIHRLPYIKGIDAEVDTLPPRKIDLLQCLHLPNNPNPTKRIIPIVDDR